MPQILQRKPYTAEELAQFNATREAFKAALNALNANYNNANKKKRPAYVEARKAYYQLPRNQRTIPNKFNNKGMRPTKGLIGTAASGMISGIGESVQSGLAKAREAVTSGVFSYNTRLAKLEANLKNAPANQKPAIEAQIAQLKENEKARLAKEAAKGPSVGRILSSTLQNALQSKLGKLGETKVAKQAQLAKLRTQLKTAKENNKGALQANINRLEGEIKGINNASAAAKEEAKKAKEAAASEARKLRSAVIAARQVLNQKGNAANVANKAAYRNALTAYTNKHKLTNMNERNFAVNRYTSAGNKRQTKTTTTTTTTTAAKSSSEYIRNMRKRLQKESSASKRSDLLYEAISNLNKRLVGMSNKNALILIEDYGSLSSNANFKSRISRRAETRRPKKNNGGKKNEKGTGWSGGGQQIIFGGGAPGAGGAVGPPQIINRGAAAPVFVPGPAAAAPMVLPGGGAPTQSMTGPTISLAPTIKVNVPPAAAQAATQMLPPMERSALNNAGGYQRAASLVKNAGGPESVSRALNALQSSNGNVPRAMEKSGLPRNVFMNVNKLGGPVTARRALTAVKKVSKKVTGRPATVNLGRPTTMRPASAVRPATVNLGRPSAGRKARQTTTRKARRTTTRKAKKYVSSACKPSQAKHIKLIVSQLRRINLERNYLKCLLP